jgi:hypothetical protein
LREDDVATALLKIAETPEAVVFELKEPFRVVERLLSPGRDDRLYAGKCHPADMARPADFVYRAAARPAAHPATRELMRGYGTVYGKKGR